MRYIAPFLFAMMAQTAAFASEPSTYSPDYCNFQVTFPDKPAVIRRCEDPDKKRCYDLISYTQTYEMDASVNFRVICNPIQKGVRAKYTEDVAKAAIRAMAEKNDLKGYRTSFRKETDYNEAGLVGEGTSGAQPKIYIAQLWVGETSVMSVEAELVGQALEASDKLFADVMKSVGLKKPAEKEPEKEETKAEKPESQKSGD
ncbi:MAG: hypothetical protein LRY76_08315 [Alphaproteobacteria bacterium]|nr:hypothetical protein [Alphaproteobacteria bacterium]